MYQALYRKYRPYNFDEVVGQNVVINTLKNEILNNKITHAYLFTGPRGTGKTSVAKIFAKTINCLNIIDGIPCDACVNCTQTNDKQTTDIIEIDAASNNGVDEIRELKSKVNLVPNNSKYKVYIIDEVHMLTVGAFNALLKTLEEPPKHIIFILATTEPHKIPTTILSRCQRFDFKKLGDKKISERLEHICKNENIKFESDALLEIARLSDGGMRDAISMLDQVIAYDSDNITISNVHAVNGTLSQLELKKFIINIFKRDVLCIFNTIDDYNNNGKNILKLTEEIILFLRNTLLSITVPEYLKENNIDISVYEELSNITTKDNILNMVNILNKTLLDMKNSSNPKLILELAIIQMLDFEPQIKVLSENQIIEQKENNEVKIIEQEEKQEQIEEKNILKQENPLLKEKLKEIKKIRINNTLSQFSKQKLMKLKSDLDVMHSLILDLNYSKYATLVIDGILKAASDTHLIFVYKNLSDVDLFNESIVEIENMFKNVLNNNYKIIATSELDWEEIKQEFNSKTKQYHYQDENIDIYKLLKPDSMELNEMEKLFGNIVEYE